MYETCLEKQRQIKELFSQCASEDLRYQKLIELGRELSPLSASFKIPENLVKGCQSTMFLHSYMSEGKMFFEADSDALISAGLAAILLRAYNGETPEAVLKCPPNYLEDLGISASLTPNRANGLYSIHLKMKQDALKFLVDSGSQKANP